MRSRLRSVPVDRSRPRRLRAGGAFLLALATVAAGEIDPDGYPADLPPGRGVTPATEVLATFTAPAGFRVDLIASEPRVAQPVSLSFDERGRLWVVQCYSFKGRPWNSPLRDRITVLDDRDGDGSFERAQVFTDQARNCTGVCPGRGGVWALMLPNLVFIPDRDGDGRPDGEPVVVLDGWNDNEGGHCVANNPSWGPDGWLYGQHGIQGASRIGAPGTPAAQRTHFAGGIWRYHPERKVFEVVCTGTTNPWGLDWDEHGEAFFSNTVIGHLWHAIPGARLKRMYGSDGLPGGYQLLDTIADHKHWTGGDGPRDFKKAVGPAQAAAGGGHAHAGILIYQGGAWPAQWHGAVLMNNLHGRRMNVDRLEREGSGYVAHHGGELITCSEPSYRPVPLCLGPDGNVYLADWAETGGCHDGGNRRSGRIWRVAYGAAKRAADLDLAKLANDALVALLDHANVWYPRQATRLLRERALAGQDLAAARAALAQRLAAAAPGPQRLRALWALHAAGGLAPAQLERLLADADEDLRAWAIRLLVDEGDPAPAIASAFAALAATEPSARVRLALASAAQRIAPERRWPLLSALCARAEDANDRNLPLMCWYALEPLVGLDRDRALRLVATCKLPAVTQSIARRAAEAPTPPR